MDGAIADYWTSAVPLDEPDLQWKFEELNEFGEDGWTISFTHTSVKKDA